MESSKIEFFIINWLKDYLKKSKTKGFVVGVSGGVDSALTSVLCAKTKTPTLCIQMGIHQQQSQIFRAVNHMNWLSKQFENVKQKSIDLTKTFEVFKLDVCSSDGEKEALSLANTRARIRMSCLYYYASVNNSLVVGTGNKVEDFGIGFFTKYGDGGVDLSPIADLTKSQVFSLAKYLGINKEILDAPPTDGLWKDDRTDEDQIGAKYRELEWAMYVDKSDSIINSDMTERQKKVLELYRNLNMSNKHKMLSIPVCKLDELV